jgi:hypothetical protein
LGLRSIKSWAKHLFIPGFLLFTIPNNRGVVNTILVSSLSFGTVTLLLLLLLHVYKFLNQQVHIAANFRFIRTIFIN